MVDTSGARTIKTTEISCLILQALKRKGPSGVTELANELDLSKAAVYNHVATLHDLRFVKREREKYTLSHQFLEFGLTVRSENLLYQVGKDIVDELAEDTGAAAHMMIEEFGRGVNIYKSMGEKAVIDEYHERKLGRHIPLHVNSCGKSILAFSSKERVNEILNRYGLPKKTENTITDREALFDRLSTIKERGYALNDEEEIKGTIAVAAPVCDPDDQVLGAISLSGPVSRIDLETMHGELSTKLKEGTNLIEIRISSQRSFV